MKKYTTYYNVREIMGVSDNGMWVARPETKHLIEKAAYDLAVTALKYYVCKTGDPTAIKESALARETLNQLGELNED